METKTIKEYLIQKGIEFRESNGELITKCLFNSCDNDSADNESHLYFNSETGQYQCKKCGEQGNLITLVKHFGDNLGDAPETITNLDKNNLRKPKTISPQLVEQYHQSLPDRVREYLNARGITDELISENKLGWGNFYGKNWITIPIPDKNGKYQFFKLRKDPEDNNNTNKYMFYPAGSEATIYGWENLKGNKSTLIVCEGEFDSLILSKFALPAITSTAGAGTFKKEWLEHLANFENVYVAFDKDETGERESEKLIATLAEKFPEMRLYKINFPERMTEGKDVTDYFEKYNGNPDEFIYNLAKWKAGRKPIDTSKFKMLTSKDLVDILGLTIKRDEANKLIAFMSQLSAYTENSQFNVSFNAPSSTGKSFIPLEISNLFPANDLIKLGNCSPNAFYHEQGKYDKAKNTITVDLSRKIIIFLDQPSNLLLEKLRSLLSHDEKELQSKITDKSQQGGNKTKTVIIKGFPAVTFCSAGLKIDEQEGTRFVLLSPEISQEKIREAILEKIKKETNNGDYRDWLESHPERALLIERIEAIRDTKISDVIIPNPETIEKIFLEKRAILKPRHQRDIGRLINIVKTFALLNLWFREKIENNIVSTNEDIEEAIEVWNKVAVSQEYNLPPYVYDLYNDVIIPAWEEKNKDNTGDIKIGISRQEILKKHYAVLGRLMQEFYLRQNVIPMLEAAGLVHQDKDPSDGRKFLIYPTVPLTTSPENNSEQGSGVNSSNEENNSELTSGVNCTN